MTGQPSAGDARDLDETRRLLYMVLAVPRTPHHDLAGTVVNALKHHQGLPLDAADILDRLARALDGDKAATQWVQDHIAVITGRLSAPDLPEG
jgi:hypothetical protein